MDDLRVKLPLVVLGFGGQGQEKRLLAVGADDGSRRMLPVFTDPERAEIYRRWQEENIQSMTVPISMLGVSVEQHKSAIGLNPFVIDTVKAMSDVLGVAMLNGMVVMVAVDPFPDDRPCLCMEVDEFFEALD